METGMIFCKKVTKKTVSVKEDGNSVHMYLIYTTIILN